MADPSEKTHASEAPADVDAAELLDAFRGLAAQVGSLQDEIHALRSSTSALPTGDTAGHGWEDAIPMRQDSPPWVRSLDSPTARRPAVHRLLLEVLFLAAVAALAAIADLGAPVIVAVMAGAWALVAAAEWAAAREAARREHALYESALGRGILGEDPSWFEPPAGRSVLETFEDGDGGDRQDTAARLPPPIDE